MATLGDVKLTRLEPVRIERLLAGIQARRQAQHNYAALRCACVFAVRWRWLSENPLDGVQKPRHRAERGTIWTPQQLRTFLKGTREHWLGGLWHILLASGCRVGELLALTW